MIFNQGIFCGSNGGGGGFGNCGVGDVEQDNQLHTNMRTDVEDTYKNIENIFKNTLLVGRFTSYS